MEILVWIIVGAALMAVSFWMSSYIIGSSKNRKKSDKVQVPNHKSLFKVPTWRFQKFPPSNCPHHNGIYRTVEVRVLSEKVKKKVFVCADCVSAIEIEEINERDKFKV
jgi:hypothetical protein